MDFLISVVFVSFKSDKYFRFGLFLRRENFTEFTNNSDYKLLAKVFSLRLNSVIDSLVDQNQAAFIKGYVKYLL